MTSLSRLLLAAALLAPAAAPAGPVTPEHRAFIAAAVPATAPATPAQPRRLLVFTQTKGFRHASIETGVEAITLLGQRTGAYTATATEDPGVLTAETLRGYDAVLFLNVTGNIFDRVESQQALLDFVRAGGGVAGIHSATDACYEWPEWGAIFGGWFDGHPWNANAHVTVWIEDPAHPINAAFGGAMNFAIQDEIYQLKGPDFRSTHQVLTSLDPRGTDMTLAGIKRTDGDFPITMIREYGRGRVFYCSLGHNHHIYWNPTVLGHYLAGLQWVLGDLAAPVTPRPRGALPPLAGDPRFWDLIKRTGHDADPRILARLDRAVAEAGTAATKVNELARQLLDVVTDAAATPAARQAAAQRLGQVLATAAGQPPKEILAALAPLLSDPARVDEARLALDPVSGREVDALFVAALASANGRARLAVVQSVGLRRIAAAVPRLTPLLKETDPALARAAALALGRIANRAARRALEKAPDRSAPAVVEARLELAARSPAGTAARIYEEIYANPGLPEADRATALRGLIATRPASAVGLIRQTLAGNVLAFQQAALEAVTTLPARDTVAQLASALPQWTPEVQEAVASAFGRRGEAAAVPSLLALLDSPDAAVRAAALDALGRLPGDRATVERLARLAAGSGDDARAAADALAVISGRDLDAFIQEQAARGEAALRPVYLQQLARRGQTEATPLLLGRRTDPDAAIRAAALDALAELAAPADQAAVLAWALGAADAAEQNRAVRALISITLRDDAVDTRAAGIIAAIDAGDAKARLALLPVLPRVVGAPALASLAQLARGPDAAVATAAVANLGRWPDNAATGPLVVAAEQTADAAVRRAAVAAAERFLARERDAAELDETNLLGRLLALPGEPAAKESLLVLLSRTRDEAALAVAEGFLADPALAAAAQDALDAIRANRAWPPAVTASSAPNEAGRIADGRGNTAWSARAVPGAWLQLDLRQSRPVRGVTLEPARSNEFPQELEVFVGEDPAALGPARATFQGSSGRSVITLPAGVRGRYLRLQHTGTKDEGNWSVAEILVD